jgi:hypothetical protein
MMLGVILRAWMYEPSSTKAVIWGLQDAYGLRGFMPHSGPGWGCIRDSSVDAIEEMFRMVQALGVRSRSTTSL